MKRRIKTVMKVMLFFFFILILGHGLTELNAQVDVKKHEEKRNVKKLIKVLQDKDEKSYVRIQAANALGRLKDARAVDPLIAALNDKDARKNSAWALGKIGDKKAVGPLIGVLTDRSSLGREEAAEALERLGWKPSEDKEKAYYLAAKRDWTGCEELGNLAIEPLVYIMNDGPDNARIGAIETLDRLGWKPDENNEEAYYAAQILKVERGVIIDTLVKKEVKLKQEFEDNLKKLREDQKAGNLNLTEEEFRSLEKRLNQDIMREQEEIEAFRKVLRNTELIVAGHGEGLRIGIERPIGEESDVGITVHEVKRNPVGQRIREIWYSPWTEKPTKEFDWITGNFYRFNSKGNKYLFAKYNFSDRSALISIDIVEPDGNPRERIFMGNKIITRVDQDKWIEWPKDVKWARERLKLLGEN
jgi:hypothetical protein